MSVEFYSVAAQVIPVLLFAMVFESRLLVGPPATYFEDEDSSNPAHWNISHAIGRWYALWIMAVGELVALIVLDTGSDKPLARAVVWGALALGVAGVVLPLTARQWAYVRTWISSGEPVPEWGFVIFFLALLVGLSAFWIFLFFW